MPTSSYRSKAPEPKPALLWSIVLLLLSALAFFSGSVNGWFVGLASMGLTTVLLASVFWPDRFLYGATRMADGFEFRAPLRSVKRIRFTEITRIDAVSLRCGDSGLPFVDLVVHARPGSVRITEGLAAELGLLDDFRSLPNFDEAAYGRALDHEPSDLMEPFGKRFRVLTRA